MDAAQFAVRYAERSGRTLSELHALGRVVAPCGCGGDGCKGWQMVSADNAEDQVSMHRFKRSDVRSLLDLESPHREWEPQGWWRVCTTAGVLWTESSDEDEVRRLASEIGQPVERLWREMPRSEWRRDTPTG